jgi:AcrR family transcriptional regulator
MEPMAQVRPYRGVEAADRVAERRRRFLEAGLDILGSDLDLSELTVRGICRQARVTVRYFYESFTDKDDFVAAVFDWVIADIAATTQAAVTAAPLKEQSRAGMANIVRTIAADTRVGRLLFSSQLSNPIVVRKRAESGALMAMLLLQHAGTLGAQNNDAIKATSHFAVGGVGQTITAWLADDIALDSDQLVDRLAAIIDQLAMPEIDKELGQQRDSPQRHTGIEHV